VLSPCSIDLAQQLASKTCALLELALALEGNLGSNW
jgi:hypothetical protein